MTYELIKLEDFLNNFHPLAPTQERLEHFKKQILPLLKVNDKEGEEHQKNILSKFLKESFNYECNTKKRIDLVICDENEAKVIFECKSLNNKNEFIKDKNNLDSKAFYESILYYLSEFFTYKNNNLTFIILTNTRDFYLIDAKEYLPFSKNKAIKKAFDNCDKKQGNDTTTQKFYEEVKEILQKLDHTIAYTHFTLTYDLTESAFAHICQVLSPKVLLKAISYIDANTLNQRFYDELLYILGLYEDMQNSNVLIKPSKTSNTLLDSICQAFNLDREKDFENIFSLITTWNNRILFLRLLESMLLSFKHINTPFLQIECIGDFRTLNTLFFEVLAKKENERNSIPKSLEKIPYLNSSLFDRNALELDRKEEIKHLDSKPLELYSHSILHKDESLKRDYKDQKSLPLLEYLFAFLHAYDFTTIPSDIKDNIKINQNKLINSAVLGLVFEKLNGYKEGSFYTPSFITNYMCKQSLEKVVIDKFNQAKSWDCKDLKSLKSKIDKLTDSQDGYKQANDIFNSIRVCDPSVGSGHFLVSVLNQLIALKYNLNILCDEHYQRLKDIKLELQNDEIVIRDSENKIFSYAFPGHENIESHKLQKALFQAKRKLIESCLFGVDINPNSCEITKLRLWIELLKFSYYKDIKQRYLETLPNIDINIKCGNSLISRFDVKDSLKHISNINYQINEYKKLVSDYKNSDRNILEISKSDLEKRIEIIKDTFKLTLKDPKIKKDLEKAIDEHTKLYGLFALKDDESLLEGLGIQGNIFNEELSQEEQEKAFISYAEIKILRNKLNQTKSGEMYKDAFEWRFEFPEVLSEEGDFLGFDLIIGNPPYIRQEYIKQLKPYLQKFFSIYSGTSDIYTYFFEQGYKILSSQGILAFITSNKWTRAGYGKALRDFLLKNTTLQSYTELNGVKVFENATVDTSILSFRKVKASEDSTFAYAHPKDYDPKSNVPLEVKPILMPQSSLSPETFTFQSKEIAAIKEKIEKIGTPLKEWDISINYGIKTGYNEAFIIDSAKRDEILNACADKAERERTAELIKPVLRGRDIKRYSYEWAGLWIINTHNGYESNSSFEDFCGSLDASHCEALKNASHSPHPTQPTKFTQNTRIEKKTRIPPIDINEYPTLKAYLDTYWDKISTRTDKGKTPYNLRNCAYIEEFAKEKIVWNPVSGEYFFSYIKETMYFNNSLFMISGKQENFLLYVLGLMNSVLYKWLMTLMTNLVETGKYAYGAKDKIEKLPIPKLDSKKEGEFVSIIEQILESKKAGKDTQELESRLDSMIFDLYGLSKTEIDLVTPPHIVALLLLSAVHSNSKRLIEILCLEFTEDLKEAFKLCEGLKLPESKYQAKIIYSEIVRSPQFHLDIEGFFAEATSFILTGENLYYLIGLLNSKLISFAFKSFYAGGGLGENGYRYKKAFIERLPIPKIDSKNQNLAGKIIALVEKIIESKAKDSMRDTITLESKIDSLVYELYGLSKEEIGIIEGS